MELNKKTLFVLVALAILIVPATAQPLNIIDMNRLAAQPIANSYSALAMSHNTSSPAQLYSVVPLFDPMARYMGIVWR